MTEQMPGELIYEYTIRRLGRPPTVCPRWRLCCPVSQTSLRKGPGTTSRSKGRSSARGYEERSS
jgi:hypothetical protein